jgi:transcriptional regulator
MYLPKHFVSPSQSLTLEVMREYNFALLTCADEAGVPMATPLPVVVASEGDQVTVHFHLARANPQVAQLRAGRPAMLAFSGPHAYQSPRVYPDLKRVPTWNYLAVHAYGPLTEIVDSAGKDALLKSLIAIHEPPYAEQWKGLDTQFQETMLGAIAAFRMDVTTLEGKFKLNQHRKEAHASMKAGYSQGTPDERALAQWMERLGL